MRKAENTFFTNKRILCLILAAFWLLALIYTVSVPLGEAPDEVPHFNFVRYLAEKHGLPEGTEAGSESFQPPLYYAIGALFTAWLNTSDFQMRSNSDFSWDLPETSKNLLLHTKKEAFPYQGGALAWHIVRLLSIVMGTITILATYLIGREIFPDKPSIALGLAAINAFIPEFLFMSSVVNNDNLIAMLSALLVLKLIKIHKGATAWRDFIQLGVLLGLSLLTKSSAIAFVPLILMVLFSTPYNKRLSLLQSSLWSTVTGIFAFGFAGWWFLRNQLLFGDALGWSLKVSMSDLRQAPLGWHDFLWLADGLFQSFWGRFGGAAHLRLSFSLYVALSILVVASLVGCGLAVFKAFKSRKIFDSPSALLLILLALNIALIFAALVRWTMTFLGTDQARLIYPALPALLIVFLLGLLQLIPARQHGFAIIGLCFALFTLAFLTPFNFIRPVYSAPEPVASTDISSIPNPMSYDFDGMVRLVGYEFDKDLYGAGDTAQLILYWQALGQVKEDLWLQVQLVDKTGQVVFQKEGCPSGGSYSADLWQIGDTIPAVHYLRLNPTTLPGSYSLRLAIRPSSSKAWVPIFDRPGGSVSDNVAVAKVRVGSKPNSSPVNPQQPLVAYLGGKFSLVGYTLKGAQGLRPGGQISLSLYWKKIPGPETDTNYTVFTQLLDPKSVIQAQSDNEPFKGAYPTSLWVDNETIVDTYELTVNQQAQPGTYTLIAGLYDRASGTRLPVTDGAGRPAGDFVSVAKISLQ